MNAARLDPAPVVAQVRGWAARAAPHPNQLVSGASIAFGLVRWQDGAPAAGGIAAGGGAPRVSALIIVRAP